MVYSNSLDKNTLSNKNSLFKFIVVFKAPITKCKEITLALNGVT